MFEHQQQLDKLNQQAEVCRRALANFAEFFELQRKLRESKAFIEAQTASRRNRKILERLTRRLAISLKEEPQILQARTEAAEALAAIEAAISSLSANGQTDTLTA